MAGTGTTVRSNAQRNETYMSYWICFQPVEPSLFRLRLWESSSLEFCETDTRQSLMGGYGLPLRDNISHSLAFHPFQYEMYLIWVGALRIALRSRLLSQKENFPFELYHVTLDELDRVIAAMYQNIPRKDAQGDVIMLGTPEAEEVLWVGAS